MQNPGEKQYFFDKPENVTRFLRVFYVICAVLVLLDFVVHRHTSMKLEEIPAFYALFGFIACVILVFIAKGLRKLVMRRENYYETDVAGVGSSDVGNRNVD